MNIHAISRSTPNFMAHTYKVEPKNQRIMNRTDNEDNLGEKPYIVYSINGAIQEEQMKKVGKLYSIDVGTDLRRPFEYHIEYKDTGKVDLKNGKNYQYNPLSMIHKASIATRQFHRQPLIHSIKSGKTVGKIKYQDSNMFKSNDDINEPTILVTNWFYSDIDNPNIVGLILTTDNIASFSHLGTRLRQETDVCGAIFEPEKINQLKSLEGKNVELELTEEKIEFKETDKVPKPIRYNTVEVPKLKFCDRILHSLEYSNDIIGAKAVNLRRLELLKEQGKIDVIIPKSMSLPYGYLEPFDNPTDDFDAYMKTFNDYMDNGKVDSLIDVLKKNDIGTKDGLMIRSSFNGEDLKNYSAAGIYRTTDSSIDNKENIIDGIFAVVNSKYEHNAEYSRKKHNIPSENIQAGIILQDKIIPDYKFTLYTDDKEGNLKIELYSDENWKFEDSVLPHTFIYDKKTNELIYTSIQMETPSVIFDENEEIIDIDKPERDLSTDKKLFAQLKKIAKNSLVVEKEFGMPQDIEGGIKDDNIYFWQTRNIVE